MKLLRLFRKSEPLEIAPRVRVMPDPEQTAALDRRLRDLTYRPELGFHRDRVQPRIEPARKQG